MATYKLTCEYCGTSWTLKVEYRYQSEGEHRCPHCNDKKVTIEKVKTIDYYNENKEEG